MADSIAFKSLYPYYSLNDESLAFYYFVPQLVASLTLTEQSRSGSYNCYLRGTFDPTLYIEEYSTGKSDVLDPTNWPNPIDSTGTLADIYELKTQWNSAGTQCSAPKYYYSSSQNPAPTVALPNTLISTGSVSYSNYTTTFDSDGYPASITFSDVDFSARVGTTSNLPPYNSIESTSYENFYLGGRFGVLADTTSYTSIWYGLFTPITGDVLKFCYYNDRTVFIPKITSNADTWQASFYKSSSTGWRLTSFSLYLVGSALKYDATAGSVSLSINEAPQ